MLMYEHVRFTIQFGLFQEMGIQRKMRKLLRLPRSVLRLLILILLCYLGFLWHDYGEATNVLIYGIIWFNYI